MTQRAPAICLWPLYFIASAKAFSVDWLTGHDWKQASDRLLGDPGNPDHTSAADLTAYDAVREALGHSSRCSR